MIMHREIKALEIMVDFSTIDFLKAENFILTIGLLTLLIAFIQKNKIAIGVQGFLFLALINSYFYNNFRFYFSYETVPSNAIHILQGIIVLAQVFSYILIISEFYLSRRLSFFHQTKS